MWSAALQPFARSTPQATLPPFCAKAAIGVFVRTSTLTVVFVADVPAAGAPTSSTSSGAAILLTVLGYLRSR
jgi:hypothetical protein